MGYGKYTVILRQTSNFTGDTENNKIIQDWEERQKATAEMIGSSAVIQSNLILYMIGRYFEHF